MKDDDITNLLELLEKMLWRALSSLMHELEQTQIDNTEHAQSMLVDRINKQLKVFKEELTDIRSTTTFESPYKALKNVWNQWSQYDWHNRNKADKIRAYEAGCSYPIQPIFDDDEGEVPKFPEAALSKEQYQALASILYDIKSDSQVNEDELQGQRGDMAKKRMMQAFADVRDSFPKGPVYYHILWFWTHEIEFTWPLKKRMTNLLESLQEKFPGMSRESMRQHKCRAMKEVEKLLAKDAEALWMLLFYKYAPFEKPDKYLSDKALNRRYKPKELEPGPVVIIDAAMADSIDSNRPVYNTKTACISENQPAGAIKEVVTYAEYKNRQAEMRKLRQQKKKAGLDQRVDKAVSDTPKSSRKRGPRTGTKKPSRSKGIRTPVKPSNDDAA